MDANVGKKRLGETDAQYAVRSERTKYHGRTRARRERLSNRLKDNTDPLQLVIVCDMLLTGFDCPSLHTMYFDKPLAGHTLMHDIARLNRVFCYKPGGVVVAYQNVRASR